MTHAAWLPWPPNVVVCVCVGVLGTCAYIAGGVVFGAGGGWVGGEKFGASHSVVCVLSVMLRTVCVGWGRLGST